MPTADEYRAFNEKVARMEYEHAEDGASQFQTDFSAIFGGTSHQASVPTSHPPEERETAHDSAPTERLTRRT